MGAEDGYPGKATRRPTRPFPYLMWKSHNSQCKLWWTGLGRWRDLRETLGVQLSPGQTGWTVLTMIGALTTIKGSQHGEP